jgi:hypothetical protein
MMTIFVRLPLFYNSFCNNTDVAHILESFLFQTIIDELLMKYKVSLLEGQDLTHKWLPNIVIIMSDIIGLLRLISTFNNLTAISGLI